MSRNPDKRDKWLGIKSIKQHFTPKMYESAFWNDDNKLCAKDQQAEQAAKFLENKKLGDYLYEGEKFELEYWLKETDPKYYVVQENIEGLFRQDDITIEEVMEVIKSMSK